MNFFLSRFASKLSRHINEWELDANSPGDFTHPGSGKPINTWEIGSRLGYSKDFIMTIADTNFVFLSDVITLPQWFPYKFAFSLGDIFISTGSDRLWSHLSEKEISK